MTTVGNIGTATIDFGATPATEASVAVSDATIPANVFIEPWIMARSTTDNTVNDHQQAAAFMRVVASEPNPGVGFTITAYCLNGFAVGTFKVDWTWSN